MPPPTCGLLSWKLESVLSRRRVFSKNSASRDETRLLVANNNLVATYLIVSPRPINVCRELVRFIRRRRPEGNFKLGLGVSGSLENVFD